MDKLTELKFEGFGTADESALRQIRALWSRDLPPDYAEFLRTSGGGSFGVSVACRGIHLPEVASEGCVDLDGFLGVSQDWSIVDAAEGRECQGIPRNYLPIASAFGGGDYYCLRDNRGSVDVAYWHHETGEFTTIAESFLDLIDRLELDPEIEFNLDDCEIEIDPDLLE